jgi:hypothetical protein
VEYKVISWTDDTKYRMTEIGFLVAEGWQLQGGVSICVSTVRGQNEIICAQALIRTVKPEKVSSFE